MKLKLDISEVAQAAKLLQASSDGVICVEVPSYGAPKVKMTEFGFKWAFPRAKESGDTSAHDAGVTYYYTPEAKA